MKNIGLLGSPTPHARVGETGLRGLREFPQTVHATWEERSRRRPRFLPREGLGATFGMQDVSTPVVLSLSPVKTMRSGLQGRGDSRPSPVGRAPGCLA